MVLSVVMRLVQPATRFAVSAAGTVVKDDTAAWDIVYAAGNVTDATSSLLSPAGGVLAGLLPAGKEELR